MPEPADAPFRRGDLLLHRFNPDLGAGRVVDVEGRRIVVKFPKTGARLTFAAGDSALRPLALSPGDRVRLEKGEEAVLAERLEEGFRLEDGRVVAAASVWPLELPEDPLDKLAALDVDRARAFANRLDGMLLQRTRRARGLGTFLGGRVKLYPHQLHVAERATQGDPVRWLLSDEVGLGKTIEACFVLSHLLRTERADRALVVAPATLVVQWLGELYRKFHQTFVLLDKKRREDVAKEMGAGFNPFEAHRHAVIALEDLEGDPRLTPLAAEAGLDLLVVDESHRLERAKGTAGSDAYLAVAPLTRTAKHVLLLTATPLESDVHGFFTLLQLVRPDAYESEEAFTAALAKGDPLPPCTSATRRVDIGGLPPRVPMPVDLARAPEAAGLTGDEKRDAADPRVEWIVSRAARWASGPEAGKTLVFCHEKATLDALRTVLESATRKRVAIFHEELSPDRRDLEVAEFRRPEGPLFLVSTEAGGEGRNFEFCRRLVLFDLPSDPAQVEQRIGRLDRISRTMPVEIVYFRPPDGFGAELVELYEEIGLFMAPLGGLERPLAEVTKAIERSARLGRPIPSKDLARAVRAAAKQRDHAVYHHLHAGGYRPEMAAGILERIPKDLDPSMERFVLGAADLFGFVTAERPGRRTWYVEFGSEALVEELHGVPGDSRWLGTFDREEAVDREDLDFFASGHALAEGLFSELEDGPRGRVALVSLDRTGKSALGLLLVTKTGAGFGVAAVGLDGVPRPDHAELLVRGRARLAGIRAEEWSALVKGEAPGTPWRELCRALAEKRGAGGRLLAAAGYRLS